MLAFAGLVTAFLVLVGILVLSIAAHLRAEEARRGLAALHRRLAAVERRLGMERLPMPPRPAAEPVRERAGETASVEERIALAWLARFGAAILGLGGIVFLVYGPAGSAGAWRLAVAGLLGGGALAFAELHRRRARPLFNQALLGLGAAVLQLAAVASHLLYQVASPRLAFAAAALAYALAAALAVRHRTEVPLAIGLLGALAAPSLLWRDAPEAGLLLYVLAAGSIALGLAVWRGFRFSLWVAPLAQVGALAAWWLRAFDARPGGPHQALGGRAVALLLAAAIAATWLAAGALARRPGRDPRLAPAAFLAAALALALVPFAALASDQPPVLAAAAAALAVAGAWLLRGSPWGLLPLLVVSTVLLLGSVHAKAPALATFLPLAVWGTACSRGLLRPGSAGALFSGIAGTAFLVVAGELLAPFHWRAFGLVTVAWSLAWAAVAMARRETLLLAATGLVAFLGLAGAAWPHSDRGDHVLLAICAAWVAVHLGGLGWRIRTDPEPPDWPHVVTASGTGVSYGLLVLFLAPREPLVRGLLAALTGGAHVALGGAMLARSPPAGNALQAVAVALFAAAAMHVLPGAYSTLAWAALAILLVWAGFRRRSRLLRSLGLGLFAVIIARVAVWDLWQRPLQLGALFAVGALLLAASYLYARLGARLAEALGSAGRAVGADERPAA